jgi:hypothetical protein
MTKLSDLVLMDACAVKLALTRASVGKGLPTLGGRTEGQLYGIRRLDKSGGLQL